MQSVTLTIRVSAHRRFFIACKTTQLGGIPKYHQLVSVQVAGLKAFNKIKVENVIYQEGGAVFLELAEIHPGTHGAEGSTLEGLRQSFFDAKWTIQQEIQDEPVVSGGII